ncbi:hypothetical protein IAQ61_000102 [Plenodomus lingam]|uniref:uncharacterized protein n=1 Tax=Leptosphaeria maculans TaxID=5022 RepID=UPI003325E8C7|nr:hypothetical protein IAQ61_000102 [Plenodomus lingam]
MKAKMIVGAGVKQTLVGHLPPWSNSAKAHKSRLVRASSSPEAVDHNIPSHLEYSADIDIPDAKNVSSVAKLALQYVVAVSSTPKAADSNLEPWATGFPYQPARSRDLCYLDLPGLPSKKNSRQAVSAGSLSSHFYTQRRV